MLNFELYKIFVVVANEHNIKKAGAVLNLSQTTIIKNIKLLENSLKFKLFKKVDSSLVLTDLGNDLYRRLKPPIYELFFIDTQFNDIKNLNIGSHSRLSDKLFNNCINKFYIAYPKVNLNFNDIDTSEMLKQLNDQELDVVFSKKVDNMNYPNLRFIKIGYLTDVFVVRNDSDLANKKLTIKDLKNEIIYVPKSPSQTLDRLGNLINIQEMNLKSTSYDSILKTISSKNSIGLVTKEYLNDNAFEKNNLIEIKTELNLKPVEYGIYLNNNNKSKDVNNLVRIIKSDSFFKEF